MGLVNWDEVEVHTASVGPVGGRYQDLGEAAGSVEIGLGRFRPDAGNQTTPVHIEGGEEEISFVLAGTGWSVQDGLTYEVRAGDVLVHLREEESHTLVAGDDGLDVLAFGERAYPGATHLVRAGIVRIVDTWVEALGPPHPYEREAAQGRVEVGEPQPRPDRILHLDDAKTEHRLRGGTDMRVRNLGPQLGAVKTNLRHLVLAPGSESYPPHCHSAEEELFVVLEGDGVVLLGDEEHPVRAGSIVSRPAGTGVAHGFRAGGRGMTLLAYGQRNPSDIAFYPRARVVSVRGIGVKFRVDENADSWPE
jgi:uncharacterized cupin superfamily protein